MSGPGLIKPGIQFKTLLLIAFIKQTWSWPSSDKIWRFKQKKHLIIWFNHVMLGIHDIRVKSGLGDVVVQPCANCEQRNPAPTPVQSLCEAGTTEFQAERDLRGCSSILLWAAGSALRSEQVPEGFIPLGCQNPQDEECTACLGNQLHSMSVL